MTPTACDAKTVPVLGIPLHCVSMEEAVARIGGFVDEGSFHLVITLGVEMVMNAQQDEDFRRVARQAHLLVPDTIGVVWAARRLGASDLRRVAGIELIEHLAALGAQRGWRFFFLGGKPGIAEEAAERLAGRHPGLIVAGCHDGYFKDDAPVVAAVRASGAHLLLAAMGSPRQETWSWQHGHALGVPVAIGVGGSFDVLAGRTQRAPSWMRRLGLEWLYRLWREPRRAGRMLALPRFALRVLLARDRA